MDKYSHFEKQPFTYGWALVLTERLTVGHHIAVQAELPFVNWVPSDPQARFWARTAAFHHQMEVVHVRCGSSRPGRHK